MNVIKKIAKKWMDGVKSKNRYNVISMFDQDSDAVILDLGCDDGTWTRKIGEKIGTKNIYGVEVVASRVMEARNKGIKVSTFDLNGKFDYEDSFFDVVH